MAASSTHDHTVPFVAAVASWNCLARQTEQLLGHGAPSPATRAHFELTLDESAKNTASFRLRLFLGLRAMEGKRANFFFCIPPNRILDLDGRTDRVPNSVRTAFLLGTKKEVPSTKIVSLRFRLSEPGIIVLPKVRDLTPSSQMAGRTLELLESLARATEFTISFEDKSDSRRASLLAALHGRDWTSTAERALDLDTLYTGHGAKLVQGAHFSLDSSADGVPAESPPSYDELAPTPPPVRRSLSPPRKKLKQAPSAEPSKQSLNMPYEWETMLAETSVQLTQQFRREMREGLDQLETRVKAEMAEHVVGLEKKIDERLAELKEEMHDDFDDAQGLTKDEIELSLDERMSLIKDEVNEYAKDEMRVIEDGLRRDLSEARVSFEF